MGVGDAQGAMLLGAPGADRHCIRARGVTRYPSGNAIACSFAIQIWSAP